MGFFDSVKAFFDSAKKESSLPELLGQAKKKNAAELRITPGVVPQAMVKGRIVPLSEFPLDSEEAKKLCYSLFTDAQKAEFEKDEKIEIGFGIKKIGNCRANIVSSEGEVRGIFTIL